MTFLTPLPERGVLRVSGDDRETFLQGLVTNDVRRLATVPMLYAAMLTPQGKFLFDFLMRAEGEAILLDTARDRLPDLLKRLTLYKLRAKVTLEDISDRLHVHAAWGEVPPPDGIADPRHPKLGWRVYAEALPATAPWEDYEYLRLSLAVPDGARDMAVDKALPMDFAFEALNGVDFEKGCYVGQEVTARMKYRSTTRKAPFGVRVDGSLAEPGTDVRAGDRTIGEIRSGLTHSTRGTVALAHLRLDDLHTARTQGTPLTAGDVTLEPLEA